MLIATATIVLALAHVRTGWWIVGLLLGIPLLIAQAAIGVLILVAATNGSTTWPGESAQWVLIVVWSVLLVLRWINPFRRAS